LLAKIFDIRPDDTVISNGEKTTLRMALQKHHGKTERTDYHYQIGDFADDPKPKKFTKSPFG